MAQLPLPSSSDPTLLLSDPYTTPLLFSVSPDILLSEMKLVRSFFIKVYLKGLLLFIDIVRPCFPHKAHLCPDETTFAILGLFAIQYTLQYYNNV